MRNLTNEQFWSCLILIVVFIIYCVTPKPDVIEGATTDAPPPKKIKKGNKNGNR